MKHNFFRPLLISLIFMMTVLLMSSCGSFSSLRQKQKQLNQIIPQLELGMNIDELKSRMPYEPDFSSRELLENNLLREVYTYKSILDRPWPQRDLPVFYHLVFENDVLVIVDTEENVEWSRGQTFVSASVGVTL